MGTCARLIVVLVLGLSWPAVGVRAQTDHVDALLTRFEAALGSGQTDAFVATTAPAMPPDEQAWLSAVAPAAGTARATVRERARSDASVLVDVFIGDNDRAFIASWLLALEGVAAPAGDLRIASITELWRFDDLVRLSLDGSRQFDVADLVVRGPDFTLTMASGTAFVSEVDGSPSALVLLGRSDVLFAPPDPTEQGQLEIFDGAPVFAVTATDAFVRLSPADFATLVSSSGFRPVAVNGAGLERAGRIFDERTRLTQRIDLGDLSGEPWALRPVRGSLLVDFETRRDGWLSYTHSPGAAEDVALIDRQERRLISQYRSVGPTSGDGRLAARVDPYEVIRTDIDITFDPSRLWLSGRASLTLRMRQPTASFSFRLATTLVVSSVSSPQLGRILPLRPSGHDSLIVGLPVTVPADETIVIEVQYHGRLAPQPLDVERPPDTPRDPFTREILLLRTAPRFLYSNEPAWYPRALSDSHAPASLRLTLPARYEGVATGEQISSVVSDAADPRMARTPQVRTVTFRADLPVRYVSFLVADMEPHGAAAARVPAVARDAGRSVVDVAVLVGTERSRSIAATPAKVARMVEFYAGLMGEAPYPSLTVAALEDLVPGGHSPAHVLLINEPHAATPWTWARDPVAFADYPDFFLAHEVAHQWWGQAVAGANYHEQWISEGFAQYLAWCYTTATEGEDAGRRLMSRMRASAADFTDAGPIHLGIRLGHLQRDRRVFRGVVYNKSAVVLHMLRRLTGDTAFFDSLRRLYAQHRFGSITVDDVEQAFQTATSIRLDRFFDRWIEGAAVPTLRMSWSQPSADNLTIRAIQRNDVFDLPYDVTVHYVDGRRARISLALTSADSVTTVPVRGEVRRVEFDDPLSIADIES